MTITASSIGTMPKILSRIAPEVWGGGGAIKLIITIPGLYAPVPVYIMYIIIIIIIRSP